MVKSVAAPQAKGKSAEDKIFGANNRAVALAETLGADKVINGTVGSILDEDGNLVVSLEKKEENNEEKQNGHYLRREFSYSQFRQVMILPDDVDHDKISAHVENGVLTVELMKKSQEAAREAKKIEIK